MSEQVSSCSIVSDGSTTTMAAEIPPFWGVSTGLKGTTRTTVAKALGLRSELRCWGGQGRIVQDFNHVFLVEATQGRCTDWSSTFAWYTEDKVTQQETSDGKVPLCRLWQIPSRTSLVLPCGWSSWVPGGFEEGGVGRGRGSRVVLISLVDASVAYVCLALCGIICGCFGVLLGSPSWLLIPWCGLWSPWAAPLP